MITVTMTQRITLHNRYCGPLASFINFEKIEQRTQNPSIVNKPFNPTLSIYFSCLSFRCPDSHPAVVLVDIPVQVVDQEPFFVLVSCNVFCKCYMITQYLKITSN